MSPKNKKYSTKKTSANQSKIEQTFGCMEYFKHLRKILKSSQASILGYLKIKGIGNLQWLPNVKRKCNFIGSDYFDNSSFCNGKGIS